MVRSLDKKWKELLFSFSGFGPNLLMVLMGAYFTDAINPAALPAGSLQAISGACLIMPAVFPILWMIAKAFDGIIDVPFAAITDTLSTKWGRRRPAIAVCFVPMVVSFALCWMPISTSQAANTAWIFVWALVFFATYTMCLIAFYGSLSNVCADEPQRLRVSSYKSFFDTISYCLVYALVPVILQGAGIHIDKLVYILLPLMLTMMIPMFLIKEGAKYGYPENEGMAPEKVGLVSSIKLTFGNRTFMRWIVVNCCAFFGLQMFLVAMNAMILGGMGMSGVGMTVLNTCAFAPVPICLYLFNKLKLKKGVRFAFQTCLLAFAVSILGFVFGSNYVVGPNNKTLQYIIGCVGGVIGSWAIGSFFMMPYLVPAQISSVEEKVTGKNHSAMYFAAQALTTSVVGAVASSLVYENIKMLFISKAASGVQWAENAAQAAKQFGVAESTVFNLGTLLVPIITCLMCIVGFILAFRMPKDYTPEIVAKELKKFNPELDISSITTENYGAKAERGEIIFVQVALSVLSGFLFGFIWLGLLLGSISRVSTGTSRGKNALKWLLGCFVPFVGIYMLIKEHSAMQKTADELGVKLKGNKALYIAFGILLPLLPLNVVGLSLWQSNVNKLLNAKAEITEQASAPDTVGEPAL